MLPQRITIRQPPSFIPEPEDIFASSADILFPDSTTVQHGQPNSQIIYKSDAFGDLSLSVTDPVEEVERSKFAHALWNAAIFLGECISEVTVMKNCSPSRGSDKIEVGFERRWTGGYQNTLFDMERERVLELGAGVVDA